jgi:hypothetical protein
LAALQKDILKLNLLSIDNALLSFAFGIEAIEIEAKAFAAFSFPTTDLRMFLEN